MWSIGVITYLLVCGKPPFTGRTQKEILSNIIAKDKKIKYPKGLQLTDACKDFISKLLCDNIDKRYDTHEALLHPWINGEAASKKNLSKQVMNCMRKYNYNNKLQDILVNALLSELDHEQEEVLIHGLLTMNKEKSNVDSNSVVDYLLLHSAIDQIPMHSNPEWKNKRISEIQQHHKQRASILNIPPSKVSVSGDSGGSMDLIFEDMDWDSLGGINVDDVLDAVDKKERELGIIEEEKEALFKSKNATSISMASDIDDEEFMDDEEFQTQYDKLHKNYSTRSDATVSSGASSIDIENRRISVGRFRAIMDKADKKYDVDDLVNNLNDGTGHISLDAISSYHRRIDTEKNLFAHQKLPTPEQITKATTF